MGLFNSGSTFASVVQTIIGFINLCIGALSALALVIFFYGLVRYISKASDSHAHEEARKTIGWSLVALFVMFSIWGILAILNISVFGNAGGTAGVPLNTGTVGGTGGLY